MSTLERNDIMSVMDELLDIAPAAQETPKDEQPAPSEEPKGEEEESQEVEESQLDPDAEVDEAEDEETLSEEEDEAEETEDGSTEEEDGNILAEKIETEHGEVSGQDLLDFYNKTKGREGALTQKEQEVAQSRKEVETKSQTLDWLQYQGERQKEFFQIQRKGEYLQGAIDAWNANETFQGMQGSTLKEEIDKFAYGLNKEWDQFQNTAPTAQPDAPGLKELEANGLKPENANEKFASWKDLAQKFNYVDQELQGQQDYRFWHLMSEMEKKDARIAELEELQQKGSKVRSKGKVAKGKSSVKTTSDVKRSPNKKSAADIAKAAASGNREAQRSIVDDWL